MFKRTRSLSNASLRSRPIIIKCIGQTIKFQLKKMTVILYASATPTTLSWLQAVSYRWVTPSVECIWSSQRACELSFCTFLYITFRLRTYL